MNSILKILGTLICFSSILAFLEPSSWWFHLPVVLALGCIVFALGEINENLKRPKN